MLAGRGRHQLSIERDGSSAAHTTGRHGIGARASVGAGAGAVVQRGAWIRFGDGGAGRGGSRYPRRNREKARADTFATKTRACAVATIIVARSPQPGGAR